MTIGESIRSIRMFRKFKQEDVASKIGVSLQTYNKWENGKTEPKASQLKKIADVLGVKADAIVNGQEGKPDMVDFYLFGRIMADSLQEGGSTNFIFNLYDLVDEPDKVALGMLESCTGRVPEEYGLNV